MSTSEKLNQLYEKRIARSEYSDKKAALIQTVLTDEIKAKLQEIDEEFATGFVIMDTEIASLEHEIKQHVYAYGETMKSDHLMAVFTKGRQTWDNKGLDLYAEMHPEIIEFRKIGEPSVSIREVK